MWNMRLPVTFTLCAALCAGLTDAASRQTLRPPIRFDADNRPIGRPKASPDPSELYGILYNSWLRNLSPEVHVRGAIDPGALNVNAWDEVPDSSWFTNRIGVRKMSFDEIASGIEGRPPAPPPWKIIRVRDEGYTPKIDIEDSTKGRYILKFDLPATPERNSAAERICTLIMYAAGFNVPLNTIVWFRPDELRLDKDSYYRDALRHRRPLTPQDMTAMLGKLKAGPDGRYRGLASQFLPGDLLGPFLYTGRRKDDPNDIIPHELRRELRGLRVIASWINHTDVKDINAMDAFLKAAEGRGYVRHYLLDFGSTMGSGDFINGPFRVGHEYIYDGPAMGRSFVTLGAWRRPWEIQGRIAHPEVGYYQAYYFEPAAWKPNYPNLAFERMDDGDAYWGSKIVVAFTDKLIQRLAAEGQYTRPEVTRYVEDVLKNRRDAIGRYWLNRITPLEHFVLEPNGPAHRLQFRDVAVDHGYAEGPSRSYRVSVLDMQGRKAGPDITTPKGASSIDLPAFPSRSAAVKDRWGRRPVARVQIASNRAEEGWGAAVDVVLGYTPGSDALVVLGWTHAE